MYLIILLAILVNIIAIIGLLVGLFHNFTQPKNKAIFGYFVVGSLFVYLVLLGLVLIYEWILNSNLFSIILGLCIISPFVIGKFVRYETLKKYTVIQIIFFIISLVNLLSILK